MCTPLPHAMLVRFWRETHLDAARASEGLSLATAGLSKTLHVCRNAWQPLPKASRHLVRVRVRVRVKIRFRFRVQVRARVRVRVSCTSGSG